MSTPAIATPAGAPASTPHQLGRTALAIGAIGIVFGDIGTSPLYSMRDTFDGHHPIPVTETTVFGVLSLMTWSLIVLVTIKYLIFVLRADNKGEGGILALVSLLPNRDQAATTPSGKARRAAPLLLFGLFGTALLYGDGIITPAISVLSAVEGLTLASPNFEKWVLPLAVVIIVGLFMVQPRGTTKIGRVFGPVMLCWFGTIALLGVVNLVSHPVVLGALNPWHAVEYFLDQRLDAFLALGGVCLVVTGGEALYADMGHFGPRPIRMGWFYCVFPALLLCYYGQGALLLTDPEAIVNPFYRLAPEWALLPLLGLATLATIIASQALISGAFSLTVQAVQLGYSPRVKIKHTSEDARGQTYVGAINWFLMLACIAVVLGFRTSSNLAAAYGLAVTSTMAITTVLFFVVSRHRLGMKTPMVAALCALFLVFELMFLGANLFKIPDGGWFPLLVGLVVFIILTTWFTGRRLVANRIGRDRETLEELSARIIAEPPVRVPGMAVYLFRSPGLTPPALAGNLRFNVSLHEEVIVLSLLTADVPYVDRADCLEVHRIGPGLFQATASLGFLDDPDVPELLHGQRFDGREFAADEVVYVVGAETVRSTSRPGMARWREHLFAVLARNATPAARYFGLPDDQTLAVGLHVDI